MQRIVVLGLAAIVFCGTSTDTLATRVSIESQCEGGFIGQVSDNTTVVLFSSCPTSAGCEAYVSQESGPPMIDVTIQGEAVSVSLAGIAATPTTDFTGEQLAFIQGALSSPAATLAASISSHLRSIGLDPGSDGMRCDLPPFTGPKLVRVRCHSVFAAGGRRAA